MRSSIRIAGPLAIIFIGVVGYFVFFYPIKSLLWIYQTRMSWSGIVQHEADLKPGHLSWYESGYKGQEAVLMVHGLGAEGGAEWRNNLVPVAEGHFRVFAPDLLGFGSSARLTGANAIEVEAQAMW